MSVVARNQFLAVLTKLGNSLFGKSIRLGIRRSALSGFEVEKRRPEPRQDDNGNKFAFPIEGARHWAESALLANALRGAPRTADPRSRRLRLYVTLIVTRQSQRRVPKLNQVKHTSSRFY